MSGLILAFLVNAVGAAQLTALKGTVVDSLGAPISAAIVRLEASGRIVDSRVSGIYQGPPAEQQLLYRLSQLTCADDHPGNKIPALRFMFEVTPPKR